MGIHQRKTHPYFVAGCFTCKVSTVVVGAVSGPVSDLAKREDMLAKDMAAYQRMKQNGVRPAHLTGAAYVEKNARHQHEAEHPRLMMGTKKERADIATAVKEAPEIAGPLLEGRP